jgi:phage tail-like protein
MKQAEIQKLLPEVIQRTISESGVNPFSILLSVMEDLNDPVEKKLEKIETYFNPYLTNNAFVLMLAEWLDLGYLWAGTTWQPGADLEDLFPPGVGQLRELVQVARSLYAWRGTVAGLQRFLRLATGLKGFRIYENVVALTRQPKPYHLVVYAPDSSIEMKRLIRRIVETQKPAHVTYELIFESIPDKLAGGRAGLNPRLEVVGTDYSYPLSSIEMVIGRIDPISHLTPDIDLTLVDKDKTVAVHHALILYNEQKETFSIKDGSDWQEVAIFVDNQPIPAKATKDLHDEAQLIIGQVELKLYIY